MMEFIREKNVLNENVLIIKFKDEIKEDLVYPLDVIFKKQKVEDFENIFKYNNMFFQQLDEKIIKDILDIFYYVTKDLYVEYMQNKINIKQYIQKINKVVTDFVHKHNFIKFIREFAYAYIPVPDLSYAGTRPQDEPEKTFTFEDYQELHSLCLFIKCWLPIFCCLYTCIKTYLKLNKYIQDESSYIIMLMFEDLFSDIIAEYFSTIDNKLEYYIESQLPKEDKLKKLELYHAFKNISNQFLYVKIINSIYFKKFLEFKFDKEENIVTAIYGTIMNEIRQFDYSSRQTIIKERRYTKDDSDDESFSYIEMDTPYYKETIDLEILIDTAIDEAVDEFTSITNTQDIYQSLVEFYTVNIIQLTEYTKLIISLFLKFLNIPVYIRFLNYFQICKMIAFIQLWLYINGYHPDLIIALAVKKRRMLSEKDLQDKTLHELKAYSIICPEYQKLAEYFTHLDYGIISFDKPLIKAIDEFLEYEFVCKTPNFLLKLIGDPLKYMDKFIPDKQFGQYMVKLVYNIFTKLYEDGGANEPFTKTINSIFDNQ